MIILINGSINSGKTTVARQFHVVLTYPLGQEDYDYLQTAFADLATPIHTFTLSPALEVALTDRGERRLTEYERRRIHEQYADGRHCPPFGVHIDTTSLTPEETAIAILAHTQAQQGSESSRVGIRFPKS